MIRYQITNGCYSRDRAGWMGTLSDDVDFIQIRERDLSARDLVRLTREVISRVRAKVLVNDRIDVAIAAGAVGVHLRSGAISPQRVKALKPGMIVTVACHEPSNFANIEGADFALLAPIFRPSSKEAHQEPIGIEGLRWCVEVSPVPVLALGGITAQNAAACIQAGAAGIAAITLFSKKGTDAV